MTQRERAVVRGTRSASLCALVSALALSADAGAGHRITLIDGSRAPHVPKVLEARGPHLVMTKVRLGTVRSMRPSLTRCPDARTAERGAPVVERIGLNGRSVTFLVSRTEIAGCDRDPSARRFVGPWCGLAGWAYAGGRVGDPRLAICFDGRSKPLIAFGWINPVPRARWIVIDQPGYREVYPVAGGLPVRVSTVSGLGRAGAAVFHTAQYDRQGVLLVRRKVVAAIAG